VIRFRASSTGRLLLLGAVGALLVGACSGTDVTQAEWFLVERPGDSSVTIGVGRLGAPCGDVESIEVVESDDEVRIYAWVDGEPCADDLVGRPVVVDLEAPLGSRRLSGCELPDDAVLRIDRDCRDVRDAGG
jgi:hypothetical protein